MSQTLGYDVIGDIHGQHGKLEALLGRLGYVRTASHWAAPQGRQALFLGDLIDRGPQQLEVLHTVRSMVDAGHARCIMGNHEFNAIGWVTRREAGEGFLRRHSDNNRRQHGEFLRQVGEGSAEHLGWVEWFRSLPVALELTSGAARIRAVHAWWHPPHVETVRSGWPLGQRLDDAFLQAACTKHSPQWTAMEGLTKGLELRLPEGHSFFDHSGIERFDVRARWWHDAPRSWRDVAIVGADQAHRMPEQALPQDHLDTWWGERGQATAEQAPIFIGHYWMQGVPRLQSRHVACLDWSAAHDGPLVAYRWDGEAELESGRFVAAGMRPGN